MEREQATLPFVVPSHLSKLFGLKASVIVEGEGVGGGGGEWETEKNKEREKEAVPGANSTCWGDGETAVVEGGWGGGHRSTLFLLLFLCMFLQKTLYRLVLLLFALPSSCCEPIPWRLQWLLSESTRAAVLLVKWQRWRLKDRTGQGQWEDEKEKVRSGLGSKFSVDPEVCVFCKCVLTVISRAWMLSSPRQRKGPDSGLEGSRN